MSDEIPIHETCYCTVHTGFLFSTVLFLGQNQGQARGNGKGKK